MKAKYKIIISTFLVLVVMFAATPKSYFHTLLGHKHNAAHINSKSTIVSQNDETQDCTIEKFDTPVYYTVFKFILNFLPLPTHKSTSFIAKPIKFCNSHFSISFLRGPPMA